MAGWLMTDAWQQRVSLVEMPPAVQSASVWQSRVTWSRPRTGAQALGDEVQTSVVLPERSGMVRQQALPPQSGGPLQGSELPPHAASARSARTTAAFVLCSVLITSLSR